MKLGVWRVWYHTVTVHPANETKQEHTTHTSPVVVMVAAEKVEDLINSLPAPLRLGSSVTTNVITQIDQKHKEVLFVPKGK